jgi:hypothetical protein
MCNKNGLAKIELLLKQTKDVRPDGFGSIGIDVELSGGRKLIFRQPNQTGLGSEKKIVVKAWMPLA